MAAGACPQNPYDADELYGVDVYPGVVDLGLNYKRCNMTTEKLPLEDDFFDSVSASDVLAHIPRQALDFASSIVRQPFIDLMDEMHRVLKPGGMFYAYTPAYPAKEASRTPRTSTSSPSTPIRISAARTATRRITASRANSRRWRTSGSMPPMPAGQSATGRSG